MTILLVYLPSVACCNDLNKEYAIKEKWLKTYGFKPFLEVPVTGLEPVQYCYRGILSPLRLPISPHRHENNNHMITHKSVFFKMKSKKIFSRPHNNR